MLYSHSIYIWPTMLCVNISVGNRSRTNQLVIGLVISSWTVGDGVQKSLSVSLSLVSHCRKNSAGQALLGMLAD